MSPRPGAGSRKNLLLRVLSGVLVAVGVTLPWLSGGAAQQGCQVTVSYEVSLGQGTGALTGSTPYYYADVPIFFGQVGIYSNNATVQDWRLGWNFTAGERIMPDNIFTPGVTPLSLTGSGVQLQSINPNNSINPFIWSAVSFLGTKASGSIPGNNYKVASIQDVAFNNLRCHQLTPAGSPAPSPSPGGAERQIAVAPTDAIAQPNPVLVEYAPVIYLKPPPASTWASNPDSFSTFLIRVSNLGPEDPLLDLSRLTLQYYFDGAEGVPDTTDPLSQYDMECLDTTIGCTSVLYNITTALPGVQGARYLLNVGFKKGMASLYNVSSTANRTSIPGQNSTLLGVMELLLRIQSRQFLRAINATDDYSYFNAPRSGAPITNTTNIVPRIAVPNVRIPAYLDNQLVWGGRPIAVAEAGAPSPGDAEGPGPPWGWQGAALGDGEVQCDAGSRAVNATGVASPSPSTFGRVCGLSTTYCCYSPTGEAVSPVIPPVWPPIADTPPSPPAATPPPCSGGGCPPPPTSTALTPPSQYVVTPQKGTGSGGGGVSGAAIGGIVGGIFAVSLAAAATWLLILRGRRLRAQGLKPEGVLPHLAPPQGPKPNPPAKQGSGDSADSSRGLLHVPILRPRGESPPSSNTSPSTSGVLGVPLNHVQWWRHFNGDSVPSTPGFSPEGGYPLFSIPSSPGESSGSASAAHPSGLDFGPRMRGVHRASVNARFDASAPQMHVPNAQIVSARLRARTMPLQLFAEDVDLLSTSDWATTGDSPDQAGLRRMHTWHGVLRQLPDHVGHMGPPMAAEAPAGHNVLRRAASSVNALQSLPPLRVLPPPVTAGSPPLPHVDLDVDFETEIRPYLGQCLGTGGFGAVYRATWRGMEVAVKVLPNLGCGGTNHFEALVREVELSSKFDSERLVRVYGACLRGPTSACIVMELLTENLHQRIYDRSRSRMTALEVLQVAHDVAEGLAYLHPSVIHRDLKPSNILLDKNGRAKLADFGISRVKDPSKTYLTTTNDDGTPMYMAPEQFNGGHMDEKVDVYSWGCILNECLTRRQPWRDASFFQIIVQVAIRGLRPAMDASTPEPLRRLIAKCWAPDPRSRPSTAEILRLTDLWLQQGTRGLGVVAAMDGPAVFVPR